MLLQFKNWSLKAKITVCVLVCISVLATALTWQASTTLFDQTRYGVYSRAISTSNAATESLDYWLNSHKRVLESGTEVSGLEQAISVMPMLKQAGNFDEVFYAELSGDLYPSGQTQPHPGFDANSREWFRTAVQTRSTYVSQPYAGAQNGETLITISTPVVKNGNVIGVMGADLTLKSLQRTINDYDVGTNAFAMMLNDKGTVLAHPDNNMLMKTISEVEPGMTVTKIRTAIDQNRIEDVMRHGKEKLLYFMSVPNSDWIFAIEMDRDTEEANHRALLSQLIMVAVGIAAVMIIFIFWLVSFLLGGLTQVTQALEAISQGDGDLTQRIEVNSKDEVGQLSQSFNDFVGKMHSLVSNIHGFSTQLSSQADVTAEHASNNSQRIDHQMQEINMVATAVTEMSSATQEIANNAENTAKEGASTVEVSNIGEREVLNSQDSILSLASDISDATTVIQELEQRTNEISGILGTIQDIAEQTNLLALNAAIEAARAGEQGRGFAVVADEVRVLSQRTHDATGEIHKNIETLQSTTNRAVQSMQTSQSNAEKAVDDARTASESLQRITQSANMINDMASQIAAAAEEQSLVTAEITRNTNEVKDVSDDLASQAQLASNQAEELREISGQLYNEVSRFKL
ncbi:methyl-accepting chemotaxis protein [Vibrio sp. SCSIO 43136]|uniref:methyl-accepting chemotaxis protein n=1 Tax=Vibrio sp. SCSIO 43136 TaxID=2819101 RepID=UPI002076083B|nr:methyl-accepting chemotaxis protein [Vibrio sp. SCSIO 43136]USD64636.1 methyl-accepting chemotaxis protein [Vibrio sp. SCSIO 43136]